MAQTHGLENQCKWINAKVPLIDHVEEKWWMLVYDYKINAYEDLISGTH